MRRALLGLTVFFSLALAASCGDAAIAGGQGGGAGGGGAAAGGGGGTGTGGGSGTVTGLPCEVATVLASKCTSCHGSPLAGGAPYSLLSLADLTAQSPTYAGSTVAQRCVTRMQQGTMPPAPAAPVSAQEIAAFDAWVQGGMQAGSCGPVDAGVVPLTCASGSHWTAGNDSSVDMNPGWACQSCHRGQNFAGQNPGGVSKPDEAWFFMGTVFPSLNEEDRCNSQPPSGVTVEILGPDGGVVVTMTPQAISGNFGSGGLQWGSDRRIMYNQAVPLPYTARVTRNGNTLQMMTPQTRGDCNTCHTARGANGAQGRIVYP